jgi:hypothetical protein
LNTHLSCHEQLALPIKLWPFYVCGQRICTNIDWTWASYVTITSIRIIIKYNLTLAAYIIITLLSSLLYKKIYNCILILASEGVEPSHVMTKTLCLNHLTIRPIMYKRSPVQVSHLLQLVTKQLHYFYANRTEVNVVVVFINIILIYIKICVISGKFS